MPSSSDSLGTEGRDCFGGTCMMRELPPTRTFVTCPFIILPWIGKGVLSALNTLGTLDDCNQKKRQKSAIKISWLWLEEMLKIRDKQWH